MYGELGFDGHLADPANARDQCIRISEAFERMCAHRGIPAETVDGFCFTRFPPFKQEAVVAGHTAVQALATCAQRDVSSEIVIDWTARQFDPDTPVPLVVTLADWRAFWRDPVADAAQSGETQVARRPPRRSRPAANANGVQKVRDHGRPAVSSFSTRIGTGSSNLMTTLSGTGSSRPGSQDGMWVSSSHVPLQSSWYAALPASAPPIARSRTMAGSLSWNISSCSLWSACTWMRSWMGIFDVRPHSSQQISIQASRSLPFAFTRNFPVGW